MGHIMQYFTTPYRCFIVFLRTCKTLQIDEIPGCRLVHFSIAWDHDISELFRPRQARKCLKILRFRSSCARVIRAVFFIHAFYSLRWFWWFCERTVKVLIRQRGWSGPSLSAYTPRRVFAWCGLFDVSPHSWKLKNNAFAGTCVCVYYCQRIHLFSKVKRQWLEHRLVYRGWFEFIFEFLVSSVFRFLNKIIVFS